jgi:hypothetical protein
MPRIPKASAVKGSQKWIHKLVNETLDLLNKDSLYYTVSREGATHQHLICDSSSKLV